MTEQVEGLSVALKQGMRLLASGVCVVTAVDENGERVAMTASSVTSVSDQPPSLLVCVNKEANIDKALSTNGVFSVNVLSEEHKDISVNCAKPSEGDSRFSTGNWRQDEDTGLSYLEDALSVFFCEKQQVISYGTHNIYIGNVTGVHQAETDASLLVYAKGSYHAI